LGQSVNFSADKVIKANDGGYLILGYTFNPIDDSRFLYIVKADSLGNELWHQAYTLQWMGMITDAFQTDDNGYIILGHGLLKINQSGTTVWSKSANDTSAFSSGMTETSIIKTPDNGFIVGANLSDNPIKFFPYTTHILKFNGTGIKQWDHKIDTTSEPFIVTMGVDSFATIGLKMFDASGGNFPDTLVINIFDYSGNTKISRRLHIPTMQSIRSAIRTTMGTISVSGSYMASMINYITKISADWNNISSETLTETNFGSIQPLSDGGYLHISAPLQGLFNWSITKVDITGSTLWNKKTPVGFESFIAEPDGAIVAVHSGYSINDGVLLYKISMDGISFEQ